LRSVALLSGGLDSTVNFKCAVDHGEVKLALTFDYGQIAFESERHAAGACAELYGVPHRVVDLRWYKELLPKPMTGQTEVHSYDEGFASDKQGLLEEAWVPNRNCVLVAIGAAYAEAMGAEEVVVGFNREEAEVFPDNTASFVDRMNDVLAISTLSGIRVVTFTQHMSKAEIVRLAAEIDAPLHLVYSCYKASSQQVMCGTCQSCVRLKRALRGNDLLGRFAGRFAR
jgi:7-cyano-7-deazaguanine synthase